MTIAELGSIGELIGGVAVLVTLAYLAIQVRHSNKISMSQAYQARFDSRAQLHLKEMGDDLPELLATMRSAAGLSEITSDMQRQQLAAYGNYWLFYLDNVIFQERLGLMNMDDTYNTKTSRKHIYEQINGLAKALDLDVPGRLQAEFAKYDVS